MFEHLVGNEENVPSNIGSRSNICWESLWQNHFVWEKNSDDSEKNVVSLCMAKRHQFLVCYYCKDVDLLLII